MNGNGSGDIIKKTLKFLNDAWYPNTAVIFIGFSTTLGEGSINKQKNPLIYATPINHYLHDFRSIYDVQPINFLLKTFKDITIYFAWFWHCTSWTSGKFEKVMNISNLIHFSICFMVYAMCINEYNIDKCSVTYIMDDILGHILDFQKPYAISQEFL